MKTLERISLNLLLVIGLACSMPARVVASSSSSSSSSESEEEKFVLYYRQSGVVIEDDYLDNKEQMDHITDYLKRSPKIDSISIYAWASPEGVYENNVWLSKRRAEAAKKFILDNSKDETLSGKIKLHPMAENWGGLLEEVTESYHRWDRDKIITILKDESVRNDTKKWRIQQLDNGVSWRWIIVNLMPRLRQATWVCVWVAPEGRGGGTHQKPVTSEPSSEDDSEAEPDANADTTATVVPVIPKDSTDLSGKGESSTETEESQEEGKDTTLDEAREEQPEKEPETSDKVYEKKTILALKTNLLYDAVTAINFEVEVPVGDHFSIMAEDVFPWWSWGPKGNKYCFQMWEMGVEPRWWFWKQGRGSSLFKSRNSNAASSDSSSRKTPKHQRDRLAGHFLGVYGMSAKYDFQNDLDLCYQGEYWSAGLTYGYALPVCKWLNMEFSISAGYLRTYYRHYQPDPGYNDLYRDQYKTGVVSYFGPTKAKISLVVPITAKWRVR